jgi:threonine synthase
VAIWDYDLIKKLVDPKYQISLREGDTPLETYKLPATTYKLLIKREDKNPNGSFKDRSLAFQISKKYEQGHEELIISSSGNAAISAIFYAGVVDIELHVFISPHTSEEKLKVIEKGSKEFKNVKIHVSEKAKSDAIKLSRDLNIPNLRGSDDDDAIVGYKTIAYELVRQNPDIDAVFIPTSSGTGTSGIFEGYNDSLKEGQIKQLPAFHIAQTTKIHPMAKDYDDDFQESETSLADAIVDRVAKRKNQVKNILDKTNGTGWIISDSELKEAEEIIKLLNIDYHSYNSFLALAAFLKASKNNYVYKNPCLIFTGK